MVGEPVPVISDLSLFDQLVDVGGGVLAVDALGVAGDVAVVIKKAGINKRIAERVRSLDIL